MEIDFLKPVVAFRFFLIIIDYQCVIKKHSISNITLSRIVFCRKGAFLRNVTNHKTTFYQAIMPNGINKAFYKFLNRVTYFTLFFVSLHLKSRMKTVF